MRITFYLIRYKFTNEAKYENVEHHRCEYHDICYYSICTFFIPFLEKYAN